MRTDEIFRMRADFPMLSDSAYLLFIFILFRLEGSKCVDENGEKYIYLVGNNDPKKVLCFNEYKLKKAKKELYDLGVIRRVLPAFGQNYRIYNNTVWSKFSQTENPSDGNSSRLQIQSDGKSTVSPVEIRPSVLPKIDQTASYIIKTKEKTKEKTKARTASHPSSRSTKDDEYENPFTKMLEEMRKNGEITDD